MHVFELFFKHLIYVFVLVFIVSFTGMCYIVFYQNEDEKFAEDTFQDLKLFESFMALNPVIYGL